MVKNTKNPENCDKSITFEGCFIMNYKISIYF